MPYCAYCGHEISESAAHCPNCGHPVDAPIGRPPPSADARVGELAGFWIRFLSLAIDGILISLVTLPFGTTRRINDNYVVFFNPARNLVLFVYTWLMISMARGQTIGMMATGLRAARPDGSAIDLGRSAGRAAMAYVSGLAIGLGYLWAAWDPEKRTWHDMVADTRVFRTRTPIQRI